MLRSTPEWEAFERDQIRREPKGWHAHIDLFDEAVRFAEDHAVLPLTDPLDRIEEDIALARKLATPLPSRPRSDRGEAA